MAEEKISNEMQTPELDQTNMEQAKAFELVSKTNSSFFLTGRAGTGKTTFLQYISKKYCNFAVSFSKCRKQNGEITTTG